MFYLIPQILTGPIGNNSFSYEDRKMILGKEPSIVIPARIQGNIEDVLLGTDIVFEEADDGTVKSCTGLKNIVEFKHPKTGAPIFVFDNHNHAFYFWVESLKKGLLEKGATLFHIDQHKDMRSPERMPKNEEIEDLEQAYTYTNEVLNVGNFIIPAREVGVIDQMYFLDTEASFEREYDIPEKNIIVDIDLDVFAKELDFMDFEKMLRVTKNLMEHASIITFATSPYFIEQERAIDFLKLLLSV